MRDKERWKDIAGYERLYQVSSHGRIRRLSAIVIKKNHQEVFYKGGIIKGWKRKIGYKLTCLSKNNKQKSYRTNRLVALAFIPNSKNLREVNHKNLNPSNNHISNLEWVTPKQNVIHSLKNGGNIGLAKLTTNQVLKIKKALINNKESEMLAKKYKVCKATIAAIASGKTWNWLEINRRDR